MAETTFTNKQKASSNILISTSVDITGPFLLHTVFHKKDLFCFFYNSLKWWSIYTEFLPVLAEEILIQNIATKYGSLLNILC